MIKEENEQIQKIIETLQLGGKSKKTISNYVGATKRFLNYFKNYDIASLNEENIIEYMRRNYLNKNYSANTYNLNVCAIKFFYLVNFKKEFSNKLLPHSKLTKRLPATINDDIFNLIFNQDENLKHKCWLLLAYYSGLRADEITRIKKKILTLKNIN